MSTTQAATPKQPNLYSSAIRAPEFPANAAWLNTDKPLSLRALRGKIVLLDFWTYGCINCMHILPDLKKLERKYPNELAIISVHSAKFRNENETQNIRNAMLRYNIEHPVLNDADQRVWDSYAVRAWPTLVLIDPAGRVVDSYAGEGNYARIERAVGELARRFRAAGVLDTTPLKFALDAAKVPLTPLWYPGKVLADAATNRLFIADSNHNRIIIADLNGEVEAVAGTGEVGLKDGAFDEATLGDPHGMALYRGADGSLTLFVADTNNHAIRALDLKKGTVSTVAGTGQQAAWGSDGGVGVKAALSSPWDLQLAGDTLFIAMAGPHQIWMMDLNTKLIAPYAGSGREARLDGPRHAAAFAQPSGLASDGKRLFVADSESSSIRAVDLPGQGSAVSTLINGDLFDFGDREGSGTQARLQHPLAVASSGNTLFVADTYNHKIKALDLASGQVRTFLGNGRGARDGAQAQFYEPGGLSIAGNKLFIADTNNHKIRVVDLATKQVSTLNLQNLPAPRPAEPERAPKALLADKDTITLPLVTLAPNSKGELVLDAKLPAGHKLNHDAPQRFQARSEGRGLTLSRASVPAEEFKLPLRVTFATGQAGSSGAAVVSATIFYCTDAQGLCKIKALRFRAPYQVKEGGATRLALPAELK